MSLAFFNAVAGMLSFFSYLCGVIVEEQSVTNDVHAEKTE
jgi:hypothetical protein